MSKRISGTTRTVAAASERPVEQCIALIDYDALNDDEISFNAGDVINVTGKGNASGFWEGYVAVPILPAMATVEGGSDTDREASSSSAHPAPLHGLFPNCLVTSNMRFKSTMVNYILQNVALCLYTYQSSGEGEMSFEPGDVITALRPSASPGWWYGMKSTRPGWTAPTAKMMTTTAPRFTDPAAESLSTSAQELLFPTNFVTCDVVLIAFNFVGRQAHELTCKSGDVVQVHRRWNDGWWEGSLRQHRGIFPSNYSVPNICATSPPLFCARCRSVYASNTFQTTCATCAAEERVEDIMLQSLEAFVRGEVESYDLFAGIDVGPISSAGAEGEGKSPSNAAADGDAPTARSSDKTSGSAMLTEKTVKSPRSTTSPQNDLTGGGEEDGHCDVASASHRLRVTLLTEKDLADLAANRVKLME